MKKYHKESWLRKKYVEENMTTTEIANICDCHHCTISDHLKRNNIKIEDYSKNKYEKEDWLREKYHEEKMSMSEMGNLVNKSASTIEHNMKKHGIERRDPHEGRMVGNKYTDKKWLHKKYIVDGMSTVKMAKICDCDPTTISDHLKRNNIERDNTGENHYNWKGGISENPHSKEWDSVRENVIKRDFSRCRICNMTRQQHRKTFSQDIEVHHKTPRNWYFNKYDKETAHKKMNRKHNLITLCKQCHMRTEREIR